MITPANIVIAFLCVVAFYAGFIWLLGRFFGVNHFHEKRFVRKCKMDRYKQRMGE